MANIKSLVSPSADTGADKIFGANWNDLVQSYQRSEGYKAIVGISGTTVYANDNTGNQILSATAGTNDATVIQAAINNLTGGRTSKQKVLLIGDFKTTTKILVDPYTIIELLGSVTLQGTVKVDMIGNRNPASTDSNIDIIGGKWVGNLQNATPNSGIFLDGVTDSSIVNTNVSNCGHVGIYIKEAFRCKVIGNTSFGHGNGAGTSGIGIAWLGGSHNVIADNLSYNNTSGSVQSGLDIEKSDEGALDNPTESIIRNNVLRNNTIGMTSGAGIYRNIFTGNEIILNNQHGMQLIGTDNLIVGNKFQDNGQTLANTYDHLQLVGGTNNSILANDFLTTGGGTRCRHGINITSASVVAYISDNRIFTFGSAAGNSGINVGVAAPSQQIRNNWIIDGANGVTLVAGANNCMIRGNTFLSLTGTVISDSATGTTKRDNQGYNPVAASTITLGASPAVYQNTDGYPEDLILSGGTVSDISWSTDNVTYYSIQSATGGRFHLEPNEYLRVTYTGAPTVQRKVPL